jgi:very-short-patch-repair endonuclease
MRARAFFHGWAVLHFTWRDVRCGRQRVVDEVCQGYATRLNELASA